MEKEGYEKFQNLILALEDKYSKNGDLLITRKKGKRQSVRVSTWVNEEAKIECQEKVRDYLASIFPEGTSTDPRKHFDFIKRYLGIDESGITKVVPLQEKLNEFKTGLEKIASESLTKEEMITRVKELLDELAGVKINFALLAAKNWIESPNFPSVTSFNRLIKAYRLGISPGDIMGKTSAKELYPEYKTFLKSIENLPIEDRIVQLRSKFKQVFGVDLDKINKEWYGSNRGDRFPCADSLRAVLKSWGVGLTQIFPNFYQDSLFKFHKFHIICSQVQQKYEAGLINRENLLKIFRQFLMEEYKIYTGKDLELSQVNTKTWSALDLLR
jgi:hypothetical protein